MERIPDSREWVPPYMEYYARYIKDTLWSPHDVVIRTGLLVMLRPLEIQHVTTIDRICVPVVMVTTSGNAILGIYADNGDTPTGGTLLCQTAAFAIVGADRMYEVAPTTGTYILKPGLYWLACCLDGTNPTKVGFIDSVRGYELTTATLISRWYTPGAFALTTPCPATNADYEASMCVRVLTPP